MGLLEELSATKVGALEGLYVPSVTPAEMRGRSPPALGLEESLPSDCSSSSISWNRVEGNSCRGRVGQSLWVSVSVIQVGMLWQDLSW